MNGTIISWPSRFRNEAEVDRKCRLYYHSRIDLKSTAESGVTSSALVKTRTGNPARVLFSLQIEKLALEDPSSQLEHDQDVTVS